MTPPRIRTILLIGLSALLFFPSCAKKKEIKVGEFDSYSDPIYGFGISFPKDWVKDPETGRRVRLYSSLDARDRFLDPTASKLAGIYVEVGVDTSKNLTLDNYVHVVHERYGDMGTIGEAQSSTLAGNAAVKVPFSIRVDNRNTIYGYRLGTVANGLLTYIEVAGFNELMDDYKVVLDTALTTVHLGRPLVAKSKEDISRPAETYETYNGKMFDIAYPSNFDFKFPQKPNTDLVMELKGYRQDCTVRIEVGDAKNLTVEKVVEQNRANLQKAGYKIKNSGSSTVSGTKAEFINLTYAKGDVDSRAYFLVKGNKLYYIFLTWYRPQANVYVPTFEKMVASLRIK
jgi:hypothetical protein